MTEFKEALETNRKVCEAVNSDRYDGGTIGFAYTVGANWAYEWLFNKYLKDHQDRIDWCDKHEQLEAKLALAVDALTKLATQCEDDDPPFRAMPVSQMMVIAREALTELEQKVSDEPK